MTTIKLTYFDLRGRAEPCRLLLAQAGKKFEDNRLPPPWVDPTPWTELKPKTPWGTVPLLEYDGVVIGQSVACARFLAKEFGLAGKGNIEQAQADEIVDALQDIINAGTRMYFAKDEEGLKKHGEVTVPAFLATVEKVLVSRGGEYLVGGSLSWADIMLFCYVDGLPDKAGLVNVPKVKDLVEKVGNLPNIKAWVEARPVTAI